MKLEDKFRGGLYGLLIGDALGVPYEFHFAKDIPSYNNIEMMPPSDFKKAHEGVAPGTYSDDGAQALCLLDSILTCGKFSLKDFSDKLLSWSQEGTWAVDNIVFDVGVQTGEALIAYEAGVSPEKCGMIRPDGKGNGALMRTLPLALWHKGTDEELIADAHSQCLITHGNLCNQVCCALYCLVARFLLAGMDFNQALEKAIRTLRNIYSNLPEYEQELEWSIRPDQPWEGTGSGYVVDCLRSAFMILMCTTNYEEAVKRAIMLGNDTDTTACVTGGLAGILYGFHNIPKHWYHCLRGKDAVENLIQPLF